MVLIESHLLFEKYKAPKLFINLVLPDVHGGGMQVIARFPELLTYRVYCLFCHGLAPLEENASVIEKHYYEIWLLNSSKSSLKFCETP